MQTFVVELESPQFETFRCLKAANSVDLNPKTKAKHSLKIEADIDSDFNVGVIVGASGSGKTTLAHKVWGQHCFFDKIDLDLPVIEQFDPEMSYEKCAAALVGVGLSQVPCWIRPVKTLSNGQRARALAALAICSPENSIVLDEWTSVVDRTVAKAMSFCVAKYARKAKKKLILLSCHHDVLEWLRPDWVIDCNDSTFERFSQNDWDEKKKISCNSTSGLAQNQLGTDSASIII